MPLTIHLNTQRPSYHGHETLLGLVTFTTTKPIPIWQIQITLSGHATTKIQKVKGSGAPAANYRSNCTLFERAKILLHTNGEVLAPGAYEWPFEFSFPSNVQGVSKWPLVAPFRVDENHPLPPTFAIETGDAARKLHCGIEYRLEAQVLKPQGGLFASKSPLFSETTQLDFLPSFAISIPSDSDPDPYSTVYRQHKEQLFNIKSMLLLSQNKGRSLSMQEKLQSWFSTSRLPKFSFKVAFSYPTRLVQFAAFPCHFDIAPFMEDSSVTEVPEILLRSVSLAVISRTSARAAPTLVGAISAEIDERIEILNRTALGMPASGRLDLGQVFGPLLIRKTDVSFATFNICRSYRLSAVAVFECGGKTNEFRVGDLPIEVIAGAGGGDLEKKDLGSQTVGVELDVDVEDELPPVYTPDSTSPVQTFEKV
ncbi:hypothetical protein BDV12DRAFT_150836 [Aspergillus spectabilis]